MSDVYDEQTLRKVQMKQLEILLAVDNVCKKHDIKYHLFAGTLLGAIRHEGFIPWDDDIDICMPRESYEKFKKIVNKSLNQDKYFFQNANSEKDYIFPFSKVRMKGTIFEEKVVRNLDINKGFYIDIFPLDNIRPEKLSGKIQKRLLIILEKINLCHIKDLCLEIKNPFIKGSALLVNKLLKVFPKKFPYYIVEKEMKKFQKDEVKYVTHLSNSLTSARYEKYKMKKEEFNRTVLANFEGHEFPIPENYDLILSNLFGDYMTMPPQEERKPHHGIIRIKF